ncbi:MAG: hypothetical protein GY738_28600 [Pseudoalteromonas sp.]|nr:hypothetical protein [Pseudoalteromonas sp.]
MTGKACKSGLFTKRARGAALLEGEIDFKYWLAFVFSFTAYSFLFVQLFSFALYKNALLLLA